MKAIKAIFTVLLSMTVSAVLLWAAWWGIKNISYSVFYESMVRQTVTEMVRDDALK